MFIDTGNPNTAIASKYCFYCDNSHDGTFNQTASSTFANSTNTAYNSTFFLENKTLEPHKVWELDGWYAEDTFCFNGMDNNTCVDNFTFFIYIMSNG